MINHYVISIMRKGAFKETVCSCTENNYLSLCQILESTDDVASYKVGVMGKDFQIKDAYLPPTPGQQASGAWAKWRHIEKVEDAPSKS